MASIEFDITDYLTEEEIKEAAISAVKEQTKAMCERHLLQAPYYRSLFETVCLSYILEHHKEELDHSVDSCLKYITTTGLFKPRWQERDPATDRLLNEVSKRLGESHAEFKEALLERVRTCSEDSIRELFAETLDCSLQELFHGKKA